MQEFDRDRVFKMARTSSDLVKTIRVRCLPDPCPQPPRLSLPEERRSSLTKADHRWLKAMAVAWEPKREVQIPLDFQGHP